MVLADTQRSIGYVLAAVLILGFCVYVFVNWRRTRAEVGSEIELAPNRKEYLSDDQLEGKKLDTALGLGLATIAVIGVALPLYWLGEPGRIDDAQGGFEEVFIDRGRESFESRCQQCHGPEGKGGVAAHTLLTESGDFVAQVEWNAPALDTVLYRYSREEVRYVLDYGRANSPMPAWGLIGGGPLNDQQLENIIDYLESIQLPAAEAQKLVAEQVEKVCAPDDVGDCTTGDHQTLGEALFNLGFEDGFAAGAYSCARCHTKGWSYGEPEEPGGGFMGPNLTNGATVRQFETFQSHVGFITDGGARGQSYGQGGLSGAGQMPGFGFNPNAEEEDSTLDPAQVMLTPEQIEAIVEYERGL